jgi:hypothetical protein
MLIMMLCCQTFEDIAAQTAELAEKPYNPGLWASRAAMLARVGYPEVGNLQRTPDPFIDIQADIMLFPVGCRRC